MRLSVSVLLLQCFCGLVHAQNLHAQHWGSRDGLPASVSTITQTEDGALWVGTLHGLARFDGVSFTVFTPTNVPELPAAGIENIAAGPDSRVYVGTDEGLAVLQHAQAHRVALDAKGGSPRITMVLPVGTNEAYFGTVTGALYHYVHGQAQRVGVGALPREPLFGLTMSPQHTLWIATGAGLFSLVDGAVKPYRPAIPLPVVPLYDLASAPDGSLFAASEAGLLQIRGDHWKLFTTQDGLPSNTLNILYMDKTGTLWVGTKSGLAVWKSGVLRPVSTVTCSVNSLFVDSERSVWNACSDAKGLTRTTFPAIRLRTVTAASGAEPVLSVQPAADGTVWMASQAGLFRQQSESSDRYTQVKGLATDRISSITLNSRGKLWIASYYGLASLDQGVLERVVTKKAGVPDLYFKALEDHRGTVWASSIEGLSRRPVGQPGFQTLPALGVPIRSLMESRDGSMWVGTYKLGLYRFAGDSSTRFDVPCGGAAKTISDTAEDDAGTLWVWTGRALSRIRDGRCANVDLPNGQTGELEGSLVVDRNHHLWLTTLRGIALIDLVEANAVAEHGGVLQHTRYFGPDDGLGDALSDSPNFSTALMNSGDLWIPTYSGVAVVPAGMLQPSEGRRAPQVTSLTSDAGTRDLQAEVRVQPGDKHLHFTYSSPFLLNVAEREYRYRLVGFDPEWQSGTKDRDATYTSLPAGRYRFEVLARLPFEAWGNASVPVQLVVLPHFYETWWWYGLLAVALCCMLALGFGIRLRALRRADARTLKIRLQERSRLARELHDTLSRGMMAIHMKIQLATALLETDRPSASAHLDSAVNIIRQSAIDTRRSIAQLRLDSLEDIPFRAAIDRAARIFRENSTIPLETTIDDNLPHMSSYVCHEIVQIVQEALTNVRLHSGAANASLLVLTAKDHLRIEIGDDGIGFDPAERSTADRYGVLGMSERAQRILGSIAIESMPGAGTRVCMDVPLRRLMKRGDETPRRS